MPTADGRAGARASAVGSKEIDQHLLCRIGRQDLAGARRIDDLKLDPYDAAVQHADRSGSPLGKVDLQTGAPGRGRSGAARLAPGRAQRLAPCSDCVSRTPF